MEIHDFHAVVSRASAWGAAMRPGTLGCHGLGCGCHGSAHPRVGASECEWNDTGLGRHGLTERGSNAAATWRATWWATLLGEHGEQRKWLGCFEQQIE